MKFPEFTDVIIDHLHEQDIPGKIDAAIILGSGLGGFTDHIENSRAIPYNEIPGMPNTTVQGHAGKLIFGRIGNRNVLAFAGRFHLYEGFSFRQTAIPVYIAYHFQSDKLIITNAAGAINTSYSVGDLMIIESIIRNNMAISPRGYGRFRYRHHRWANNVRQLAGRIGLVTQLGSYKYVMGPNYETKAEIRAFRRMGADAVGMSTATELVEAARLNLKCVAISLITNMSTGITRARLDHEDVKATADARSDDIAKLAKILIREF